MSLTAQLASASEKQSSTADNVKLNAANLRDMASASDEVANNTLTEIANLKLLAEGINVVLSKFKVKE